MPRVEIEVEDRLLDQLSEGSFFQEYRDRPHSPDRETRSEYIVARGVRHRALIIDCWERLWSVTFCLFMVGIILAAYLALCWQHLRT